MLGLVTGGPELWPGKIIHHTALRLWPCGTSEAGSSSVTGLRSGLRSGGRLLLAVCGGDQWEGRAAGDAAGLSTGSLGLTCWPPPACSGLSLIIPRHFFPLHPSSTKVEV